MPLRPRAELFVDLFLLTCLFVSFTRDLDLHDRVSDLVDTYRKKRDLIYEGLGDKFELVKPGGAFYAFVKAPGGSGSKFVEKAVKNNVLIIPGNVFSEKDTHFRISYATSDAKIQEGIEILRSLT